MPTRWCGTRARASADGWFDRIGRPAYSCIASADTISPSSRSASSSATALLPDAVAPKMATIAGTKRRR
jgi:hypothetical protein